MILRIKRLVPDAAIPRYAHGDDDAAFDLSSVDNDFVLSPGMKSLVSTGLSMEIPKGFMGSIRDRSGLAAKHAVHVLGGVIDAGYRGEIKVVIINLGTEELVIKKGDRIAQMIIHPVINVDIMEVVDDELSVSDRKDNSFGSTGY